MALQEKDRFDALMALSNQSEQKLQSRRAIQWKLKLGLWATIILITQFLAAVPPDRRTGGMAWVVGIFLFLTTFFDFVWSWSVQKSHRIDQMFHLYYRDEAERVAGIENPLPGNPYPKKNDLTYCLDCKNWLWTFILWLPTPILSVLSWACLFGLALQLGS